MHVQKNQVWAQSRLFCSIFSCLKEVCIGDIVDDIFFPSFSPFFLLCSYALLNKLSAERQEILQNSLQLFDFYSECDDFNKWMREKSKVGQLG